MNRTFGKFLVLFVTSVVGMALLGVAAFIAANFRSGHYRVVRPDEWAILAYPAVVGALLGFCSMPFVTAFLKDASLRRSLPWVYGFGLVITTLWAFAIPFGFGFSASMPAVLSVVLVSRWCAARFALPQKIGRCEKCEYDRSGCVEPGCPECGWGRASRQV